MPSLRALFITWSVVLLAACWTPPATRSSFLVDSIEASRSGSFTLSDETRRALMTPVGEKVTTVHRIPRAPVMRFAVAVSTLGEEVMAASVTFRLSVDGKLIFEKVVRRSEPNQWQPQEIDLSDYADETLELAFEAVSRATTSVLPLWGNPVIVERHATVSRPDIVLISIDCLRADHLGAYGYARDTSPNIDAFAKGATLFRHAMAASSYTLPTHASMLTGRPPSFHGAQAGKRLSSEVAYAPKMLAEAGYRVNGLVSAPFLSSVYGFERGFHTYRLMSGRAPRLVDEAIELLREGEGQSRFLFFHLFEVHMPYVPPRELRSRFGPRPADITALLDLVRERSPPSNSREVEDVILMYDGEVAFVDREIGRFLDYLRDTGTFERSLIVITSDHGEGFYEHGEWEHARPWHPGPGLYEEILHVPLIVKWPGQRSPARIERVVGQVDVFPTLLRAAGLSHTTAWSRELQQASSGDEADRLLVAEFTARSLEREAAPDLRQFALRAGPLKYIASPGREELYDLSTDPGETKRLNDLRPETLIHFRSRLRDYLREAKRFDAASEDAIPDADTLERLKALGYLEP